MVESVMLKWTRHNKGLSQREVAEALGVSQKLISNLELDHKNWKGLNVETKKKLNEFFEGSKGWEPIELEPDNTDIQENTEIEIEDQPVIEEPVVKYESKIEKKDIGLTENDNKVLTLIEFAYEGLSESKTHDDFTANIMLLKRILKKYEI